MIIESHNAFMLLAALYGVIVPAVWLTSYTYRKFSASAQARVGPRMTGPYGILQGPADCLKLLQRNSNEDQARSSGLWLWVYWFVAFSSLSLIPWSSAWAFYNVELSILIPVVVLSAILLTGLLMGLHQRSYEGFHGSIRQASQGFSALLPILICLISVGMRAGGFSWARVLDAQGALPHQWMIFSGPLYWVCFLVFLICGPVVFSSFPGDGLIHGQEIRGGVLKALKGYQLAFYRFSTAYLLLFWSILCVAIFLGGAALPDWMKSQLGDADTRLLLVLLEAGVMTIKTACVLHFYFWLKTAFSKIRSDHLVALNWRVLSFLSLFALFGNTVWIWFRGVQ